MIHLTVGGIALLAAVSFLAAAVNSVAGGGSLLTFPTLLFLGVPALMANVSSTIGLLPGSAGGTLAYASDLRGQRPRIGLLGVASAAGGVAGAVLLVVVARGVFAGFVPWLLLASCGLLAAQPVVASRLIARKPAADQHRAPALLAGQFLAGIYGAFFGGGLGVVTLALLGLFVRDDIQRLNALKVVLSGIINAVAALYFAVFAPVVWTVVAVMVPASLVGGFAGVAVARRFNGPVLRWVVIAFGVAVAIRLLIPFH